MSNTIIVKTEAGDVTVKKLALGDYGKVIKALESLPRELSVFMGNASKDELSKLNNTSELLAVLPQIVGDAWDDILRILTVVTDKDMDFVSKKLDLAEGLDILAAALELNNYERVVTAIKKLTARKRPTV